ncbi:UNVERIFIED_CONTAM: protein DETOXIFICATION 48 [Sesamum radiatum]|uniref:Protein DETOXIFICATION 48 n=1 Tax=Sesamum radiatum TaxID=300843 RepID=A0AAW2TE00_SESRA
MCSILKCLAVNVDDLIKVKEEDTEHNGSKGESFAYYTFHGLKQALQIRIYEKVQVLKGKGVPYRSNTLHNPHVSRLGCSEAGIFGQNCVPIIITSLLMYSKSFVSMLFLGHLGDIALSGGSLSISFANITGYSVLKGLAMGMEPIYVIKHMEQRDGQL